MIASNWKDADATFNEARRLGDGRLVLYLSGGYPIDSEILEMTGWLLWQTK